MTMHIRQGVAVIMMDAPPVNALGAGLRQALTADFQAIAEDPGVRAVVLGSKRGLFSAGADIRELDQAPRAPLLPALITQIGDCPKPVVAAINGAALGGGLELALGCHARILGPDARLGLPEINLGLLPGAGGTQRLPRLIGAVAALDMIASGKPMTAARALELGLADRFVGAEELMDAAVDFALALSEGVALTRIAPTESGDFEAEAARRLKAAPGDPAVAAIVDCLRSAQNLPLDEGLLRERAAFDTLRAGARSKALRYAFQAERAASRPKAAPLPGVTGVIGGGTMGSGIALAFAAAGLQVTLCETSDTAAEAARARISNTLEHSLRRGSISEAQRDTQLARIAFHSGFGALAEADLVIEAAFEDMGLKEQIFRALSEVAPKTAILCSNTSYLDIDRIAGFTDQPNRVAGMHFFSPANVMKLVEVVRGAQSSNDTIARVTATAKALGKLPVVVGNCHGFVGNRMLARRTEQVEALLQEGALPAEIDAAFTAFGGKIGPCAMSDLAGLDISWRNRQAQGLSAPIADALVDSGRLGQKTGRGYYRYRADGRTAEIDPEVTALILATSKALGIIRRSISTDELTDRLILPMINEGARILAEGIAASAEEIDAIWLNGYGFPRWRGGPMYEADQLGAAEIVALLDRYADESGFESLRACELLREMARTGGRFTSQVSEKKVKHHD